MKISVAGLLLASATFCACAQTKTPLLPTVEATGVVTGHVFCSDINEPARFAKVSLEPVHVDAPAGSKSAPSAAYTSNGVTSVDTGLDGGFTLTKVKPGSYYVIVTKSGYVSPRAMFTQKEIDSPTLELRAIIDRALPRVDVDNGQTAHAEVSLERGAAISGTVYYDDGSPAGGISLTLLRKDADGKWVRHESEAFTVGGNTDDRGRYRIASLLPDEYMVKAQISIGNTRESTMGGPGGSKMVINMSTFTSSLPFYGEGTPHQSEAKSIKLTAGTELTGKDMVLPISKLFRVTGRVLAERNGHAVNAADLKLISKDDGKELTSSDIDREDGLFHFDFVPAGEYTLKVSNARDVVWEQEKPAVGAPPSPFPPKDKERTLESYGSGERALTVGGDMLGLNVTVQPDAPK